jgi:spermidine synthase
MDLSTPSSNIHEYKGDHEFIEESGFYEEASSSSEVTSLYPVKKVLWSGRTKFTDNVLIAESEEFGKMLFLEGELQSTEADEAIYHEHLVHPALLAYEAANGLPQAGLRVLVLGGGEGATIRELFKWSDSTVKEVVWVDIDQDLVILSRNLLQYVQQDEQYLIYGGSSRCVPIFIDALKFLQDPYLPKFDIVICDLPDPDPREGEKGLYGSAFWKNIWNCMAENSILTTHCGPVSPIKGGLALKSFCERGMMNVGFSAPSFGMVAIPSFQSEWGYLVSSKGRSFLKENIMSEIMPSSVKILDESTLRRFWDIPHYYKKME